MAFVPTPNCTSRPRGLEEFAKLQNVHGGRSPAASFARSPSIQIETQPNLAAARARRQGMALAKEVSTAASIMRILIAEDDFASRILLEAVLVKWGYEVVAANDGELAWSILQSETAPPIAFVDWMMPKLSGVDLCTRIRGQARELVPYIL